MEPNFWIDCWVNGQFHFHQKTHNPYLKRFWDRLGLRGTERVLVPLCGKSRDMIWLREQGHPVVGVEVSPLAAQAFFEENKLHPRRTALGPFDLWECDSTQIYCGDFFNLTRDLLDPIEAVYDRAALVALPEELRYRYAKKLKELLPKGGKGLLISVEYPEIQTLGPPFSVREGEIESLFTPVISVERVFTDQFIARSAKFHRLNIRRIEEKIFLLERK